MSVASISPISFNIPWTSGSNPCWATLIAFSASTTFTEPSQTFLNFFACFVQIGLISLSNLRNVFKISPIFLKASLIVLKFFAKFFIAPATLNPPLKRLVATSNTAKTASVTAIVCLLLTAA